MESVCKENYIVLLNCEGREIDFLLVLVFNIY